MMHIVVIQTIIGSKELNFPYKIHEFVDTKDQLAHLTYADKCFRYCIILFKSKLQPKETHQL